MGLPPYDHDDVREGRPGLATAVYALILLCGFALGLAGIVGSAGVMLHDGARVRSLQQAGVLPEGRVEVLHDHSPAADGSAGCAVVEGRLVRWDHGARSSMVRLLGATAERSGEELVVTSSTGVRLTCPLGRDDLADAFTRVAQRRTTEPLPHPLQIDTDDPRVDPRLKRHARRAAP